MKKCSFCGNKESNIITLIEGLEGFICEECAEISYAEFKNEGIFAKASNYNVRPDQIKNHLDKYVIGQEEAKIALSVAIYNHLKRVNSTSDVAIQKSNMLLVGPSGSGKTYLVQTLAKYLDLPLAMGDANSLTQAGYVGTNVESLLESLYVKAGGNLELAERGIVYIDEIDKIASATGGAVKQRGDIGGRSVQESLLKMLEDTEIELAVAPGQTVVMNTKNILFITSGAFVGIEENGKSETDKNIGFLSKGSIIGKSKELTVDTFVKYGMIPEFMGRIPIIVTLQDLGKEDLKSILTKPKNSVVKQYRSLLRMDGVDLEFDDEAIEYIAEEAIKRNVGARGLKGIIEKKMLHLMFDIPKQIEEKTLQNNHKLLITKEMLMSF